MTAAFTHPPVHSPWFDLATQAPWEPGVYEVNGRLSGEPLFSYWDGGGFNYISYGSRDYAFDLRDCPGGGAHVTHWRGIVPPSRLPRFVSETIPEARLRVPALRDLRFGRFDSIRSARPIHVFEAIDCMPGYDLMCAVPLEGDPTRPLFIFRRRDPS